MIESFPEIREKYIEWVEDLGLPIERVLYVLLHRSEQENEDLRKRLAKYES